MSPAAATVEFDAAGQGHLSVDSTAWEFDLDAASGGASLLVGGDRIAVRALRWREKVALARFAEFGEAAVQRSLALAVTGEASIVRTDAAIARAVATLATWLDAGDRGVEPGGLRLDPDELAAMTLDLWRVAGLRPEELDARPASEVERMWLAVATERGDDGLEASGGGTDVLDWEPARADGTRIVIVDDEAPAGDQPTSGQEQSNAGARPSAEAPRRTGNPAGAAVETGGGGVVPVAAAEPVTPSLDTAAPAARRRSARVLPPATPAPTAVDQDSAQWTPIDNTNRSLAPRAGSPTTLGAGNKRPAVAAFRVLPGTTLRNVRATGTPIPSTPGATPAPERQPLELLPTKLAPTPASTPAPPVAALGLIEPGLRAVTAPPRQTHALTPFSLDTVPVRRSVRTAGSPAPRRPSPSGSAPNWTPQRAPGGTAKPTWDLAMSAQVAAAGAEHESDPAIRQRGHIDVADPLDRALLLAAIAEDLQRAADELGVIRDD